MADRFRCRIENATLRPDQRDTLDALITKLFERRHHNFTAGKEKDWLTVELVQSLREESRVYRNELSTEVNGPLPFALGYFRVRGEDLELVSDEVPANVSPEDLVLFLSEFVQPGAQFRFRSEEAREGWVVRDVGDVEALSSSQTSVS